MKYENFEQVKIICARIASLNATLERLTDDRDKAVSIGHNWDGSFPIVKSWASAAYDSEQDSALYQECAHTFIANCITRTKVRINTLEAELEKL